MFGRIVALLIAGCLVGCATTPTSLPKESTVAVVSLLGSTLKLREVGITVFGNSAGTVDVKPWRVDEHVEVAATAALVAAGRKAVRAAPEAAGNIGTWSYTNFTSSYSFAGGAPGLRKVALEAHADYLILVTEVPGNFADPFFRTNQSISGFGVYQRRRNAGVAYADLRLLLVDGKSGEIVDRRRSFDSVARPDSAWINIDKARPNESELGQSPGEFLSVIDTAVKNGLGYLGLVPKN